MKSVKCPICHKRPSQFFCSKNYYKYYKCLNCDTLFIFPQPSSTELKTYYRKSFKYQLNKQQIIRIENGARLIVKELLRLNQKGDRLLDIGAGQGYLLEEAKKNKLQFTGLEPSNYLFNKLSLKYGLNIRNDDLNNFIKKKHGYYDFITAVQVIEHIPHLKRFIYKVGNLLNKDGILYIETPNLDSFLFDIEKKSYTYLTPPDHLWVFSINSFLEVLKQNKKLRIVKLVTFSYPEHFTGVSKKLIKKSTLGSLFLSTQDSNTRSGLNLIRKIKSIIFDKILSRFLYKILNLRNKGSILGIYLKKS